MVLKIKIIGESRTTKFFGNTLNIIACPSSKCVLMNHSWPQILLSYFHKATIGITFHSSSCKFCLVWLMVWQNSIIAIFQFRFNLLTLAKEYKTHWGMKDVHSLCSARTFLMMSYKFSSFLMINDLCWNKWKNTKSKNVWVSELSAMLLQPYLKQRCSIIQKSANGNGTVTE